MLGRPEAQHHAWNRWPGPLLPGPLLQLVAEGQDRRGADAAAAQQRAAIGSPDPDPERSYEQQPLPPPRLGQPCGPRADRLEQEVEPAVLARARVREGPR